MNDEERRRQLEDTAAEWHRRHEADQPDPIPLPTRNIDPDAFDRRTVALELAIASWGEDAHTQGDDSFIATAEYFLAWLEDRGMTNEQIWYVCPRHDCDRRKKQSEHRPPLCPDHFIVYMVREV